MTITWDAWLAIQTILGVGVVTLAPIVLRRTVAIAPLRPDLRMRIQRQLPIAYLAVWLALVSWFVVAVFRPVAWMAVAVGGMVATGTVAAIWFAVRDVAAGFVLRVEDAYEVGDTIRTRDLKGRVRHVGLRSLVIDAAGGRRIRLPYSNLVGVPLERADRSAASTAHSFSVDIPRDLSVGLARQLLKTAVLNSPWSAVTPPPTIEVDRERQDSITLAVTVHAIDSSFQLVLEDAARLALVRATDASPTGVLSSPAS